MLLYVTTGEPGEREARPLHRIPETVPRLYLLGMREHDRPAVLRVAPPGASEPTPDWRFDRRVIRIGLYCAERLGVHAGDRVALLGSFGPDWLAAELALLCIGAVAVGIDRQVSDTELAANLAEAGSRIAFATDRPSAERLLALRLEIPTLETVVAPLRQPESEPWLLPLDDLLEHANTLDTAERSRRFRFGAENVEPDAEAFWQLTRSGAAEPSRKRLSHGELMAEVRRQLEEWPAARGDLAYLDGVPSAAARVAGCAFVGDGYTMLVFGSDEPPRDLGEVAPHKLVPSADWLAELERELAPAASGRLLALARAHPWLGWLGNGSLGGRPLRDAIRLRLGDRLRWLGPPVVPSEPLRRMLAVAGVAVAEPGARLTLGRQGNPAQVAVGEPIESV